jgi:ABC-type dipeptide/oligopeptide/nickel transport system ATPase subunit
MATVSLNPKKSSPLHEILQWSASRPEWQRDALRRIFEKGNLDTTDIEELERIARYKLQNPAIKPAFLVPQPLTLAHLPSSPGTSDSVSLLSLSNLRSVNRLPEGSDLPLGTGNGLTIVYGGTGAGKSSYARVIKSACRARGTCQPITPNVFASKPIHDPASATIDFRFGNTSIQATWINGTPADPRLANVFVFDADCAKHYVSYDGEAAFTPFGLDILPKLSKACDVLAARLNKDIDQWNSQITSASANWKYDSATKVGVLIQNLSKATKDSVIITLATLSTTELQRIAILRDALKSDPLQNAKQTRAAKARVNTFLQQIRTASAILSNTAAQEVEKQLTHAIESANVAKTFATGQFDATFLKGTGSDLWRKLWEAAREYSTAGPYPSQEFPSTSADARCVLCQRELDSAARDRFAKFDAFCKDKSQEISADAERTLSSTTTTFKLKSADLKPELDKIEADLSILTAAQIAVIAEFVTKSDERLHQIRQNLESRQLSTITNLPATPESLLQDAVKALEDKAATEEAVSDPIARKALESEFKELEAREWLSGIQVDVLKQIERYKILGELEGCYKDLNTTAITTKSSELSKTFVTTAYKQQFQEETNKLGLTTLEVVMDAIQGKKGVTLFGLRLAKAANGKVAEIASEGEHRCVALAAFLAELSQAAHQSALVFDDPVSSLDHWHRQQIAERLVNEAKNRQIIVFTHEVMFLNDLLFYADEAKQSPHILTVEWSNGAPGGHIDGLPWDNKKPIACLDVLDKDQTTIATQWNPQPNAANVASMRDAYSRLRSAIERIVEFELLSDVIQKSRSYVKTGNVKYLVGITKQECDEIGRLLQKCHDLTSAHTPSSKSIPKPNELKKDLVDARQLIATIRTRKKSIK